MKDLYIVHGWSASTTNWQKTIAALAKNHQIKAYLLHVPGLTTPDQKEYTIADYVAWVAQNLPDEAVVLGHSNGGRILLNAIVSGKIHPRKLILLDSAGIYYRPLKARVSLFLSRLFGRFIGLKNPLRKLVRRVLRASDYNQASDEMKLTLENMIESDRKLDSRKVNVPTTIIWGSADKTTPLWQGKKLAASIPNATLEVVDGWEHSPYLKHPIELAEVIAEVI
ncbi:MAG: alpha/beta hydrolase [Candidatus Nomurabacteria bacterium]|jgi:pimeloyl-ACP methyl ester carboxylesterase|nr:alpha/beta hydrolase [Candidatus Nomurabacteria bacterium]